MFPFSHQWIFITDTVDAIYRPNNWAPEAMMDQLADVTGNLPIAVSLKHISWSPITLNTGFRILALHQHQCPMKRLLMTINECYENLYSMGSSRSRVFEN